MKKIQIAILTLIATLTATVAISQPVNADIMDVVTMTELGKCYSNYAALKSTIKPIDNGLEISDIVKNNTDGKVKLPTGYGHKISDNDLSCRQLIKGYSGLGGEWTGIIEGAKDNMSQSEAQSVLQKLGYVPSNRNNAKCAAGIYIRTTTINGKTTKEEAKTHQICVTNVGENGKIDSKNSIFEIYKTGDAGILDAKLGMASTKLVLNCSDGTLLMGDGKCNNIELRNTPTWGDVKKALSEQLEAHRQSFEFTASSFSMGGVSAVSYTTKYSLVLNDNVRDTESATLGVFWNFKDKTASGARDEALKQNGSKWKTFNDIKFTEEEKTTLHQWYFSNYFGGEIICEGDEDYKNLTASNTAEISGGIDGKKCYAIKTRHPDTQDYGQETVRGVSPVLTWYKDYTFNELVATMSAEELIGAATSVDPSGGSQSSSSESSCYDGAGALGSIICPIIDMMSSSIKSIYTSILEPYLKIDAILFDTSSTGGAAIRSIWGIFQGFANLFFVVIFLFVIFSQITGIGVDNYGIKKILPKLIIGAVLINTSFIISQLAVDVSNILGTAIKNLFEGIGGDISQTLSTRSVNLTSSSSNSVNNAFSPDALTIVGIAGIFGTPSFLAIGPVMFVPIVTALISIVIGALFLFIILAMRQAIAVILVVISPIAFATYILPNTKKLLFDKWLDTFKGMLIAYPISSALIYGGDFVSKILLISEGSTAITNLGILLSAAAISIAPIFFIPGLIKKNMGVLSNVASKITSSQQGVTGKLKSGATKGIQNSGLQRWTEQRGERRRAGVNSKGNLTMRGRIQNLIPHTSGGRAKLAESRNKALGTISADASNRRMLTEKGVEAAMAGVKAKAEQQTINDEIVNMAKDTHNYNTETMEQKLRELMNKTTPLSTNEKVRAKALMAKLSQSGGDGNKKLASIVSGMNFKEDEMTSGIELFADYATNTDVASKIMDKDAYVTQYLKDVQSGRTKVKFEDWLTRKNHEINGQSVTNKEFVARAQLDKDQLLMQQRSDSLDRTIAVPGAITHDRAQRIINNDNIDKSQDQINKLRNIQPTA